MGKARISVGDEVLVPCKVIAIGLDQLRGEREYLVAPITAAVSKNPALNFFQREADLILPPEPDTRELPALEPSVN